MSITQIKTERREEWRELRKGYIGGSDAAACVGLNPYKSAFSLWAEKTGRTPEFEGNLATETGAFLEDFVAAKFCEVTGKKVRRNNRSIVNDEYPWAIANVDREIVGEDAGLECKTTSELNMRRFKDGEYPANYYVQCVHYMAVTGKKKWYLAVLVGNREFLWFEIERDEDEIAALMAAEKSLYEYIQSNTAPETDGSRSTGDALASIYPSETEGFTVDLTGFIAALDERKALCDSIKTLEGRRDEIDNQLKAFMGEAEGGACEGYKVSWKTSERRTFDSKAYMKDHADGDYEPYYKTASARTFRVSVK